MNMYIFNFFESKYKNKSFVNVKKKFLDNSKLC